MKITNYIIPIILFSLLSLVIVFPLLSPGFILTMDKVVVAKIVLPSVTSTHFLFDGLMSIFSLFIPTFWLQKIILFLIFFLSSLGMYKLIPEKTGFARYFGAILYSINPFVYERVMAGHWQLLLGYSLFPFIIHFTFKFFQYATKIHAVVLAVLAALLFNIDIHFLLIYSVFFVLAFSSYVLFNRDKLTLLLKPVLIMLLLILLFNSNWIAGSILGRGEDAQALASFSREDLTAFQSVPDQNLGVIFNLLSGYGFWAEVYDYFILSKNIVFFWPLVSLVIIGISLWGLVRLFQEKERSSYPLLITLIVMFLLSLDLAGGVALKSFANVAYFLYDLFPFLRGFREPQKLVGIVMFCYAFFGSIGLASLLAKVKKGSMFPSTSLGAGFVLSSLFLILPFIYTPTFFGGFWGQLKPVFYPDSWYEVNKILKNDKDTFLTVFFPWHQYTRFRFANNRVVANPASYFFDKPVISSQNYETMSLNTHDTRTESLHVEGLLSIEKEGVNLLGDEVTEKFPWGESLSPINVKYIILAKDDDWRNYRFLDTQTDLAKVSENDDLVLYQNLKWGVESENTEATETTDR